MPLKGGLQHHDVIYETFVSIPETVLDFLGSHHDSHPPVALLRIANTLQPNAKSANAKSAIWPAGKDDPVSAKRLGPPELVIEIAGINEAGTVVVGSVEVVATLEAEVGGTVTVVLEGSVAAVDDDGTVDEVGTDVDEEGIVLVDDETPVVLVLPWVVEVVDGTLELEDVVVSQAHAVRVTETLSANATDKPRLNAVNAFKMDPP